MSIGPAVIPILRPHAAPLFTRCTCCPVGVMGLCGGAALPLLPGGAVGRGVAEGRGGHVVGGGAPRGALVGIASSRGALVRYLGGRASLGRRVRERYPA